eukprot:546673-Prymnesium_polylepis.1
MHSDGVSFAGVQSSHAINTRGGVGFAGVQYSFAVNTRGGVGFVRGLTGARVCDEFSFSASIF